MANDKNDSNTTQDTVTVSTEDPTIQELQKELKAKKEELETIKKQTANTIKELKDKSEIKTNLEAKIIKQDTFAVSFKNGYADGTVAEAKKKILAERAKAKAGRE